MCMDIAYGTYEIVQIKSRKPFSFEFEFEFESESEFEFELHGQNYVCVAPKTEE